MNNILTSMFKITSLNSGIVKRMNYCCNRVSYNVICNSISISDKAQNVPACERTYKSNSFKFVNKSLGHISYLSRLFSSKVSSLNREQTRVFLVEELEDRLRSQSLCSHDDWKYLYELWEEELPNSGFAIEVLSFCIEKKWFALGKSLIDYLDSCNINLTLAGLGRYVRLCGEFSDIVEEEYIFNLINKIKEITPVLDVNTTADVIVALATTSRWNECFQLMNPNKIFLHPTPEMYNAVITAAFKNSKYSVAWEYLEKILSIYKPPTTNTCIRWINILEKQQKTNKRFSEKHMLILMDYFGRFNVHLPQSCTEKIKKFFSSDNKWRGEHVFIPPNGECCHCNNTLESNVITEEEFEYLRRSFLDDVLARENAFLSTTPKELEEFKTFIMKTAPFDYVLDGLNVGFYDNSLLSLKLKKKTIYERAKQLCDVVHELVIKKNKVLVVGKHHMLEWNPKLVYRLRMMAYVAFVDNLTPDDSYVLYAALYSGIGTKFISGDLYRDHQEKFKKRKLKDIFRKWQLLHQVLLNTSDGKIALMEPVTHGTSLQITENSIHVPCTSDEKVVMSVNPPEKWLCLTKIHAEDEQKINIQENTEMN